MKFLVAPQQFKGTLTARQAAESIARGIRAVLPDAECEVAPIADGGSGTVDALLTAFDSRDVRRTTVAGPLGTPVSARWGVIENGQTAVLEMASASGHTLVAPDERRVLDASSFGTGELIRAALDAGCTRILLGVGDSATCDGGIGAAAALGVRFYDAKQAPLSTTPRDLQKLSSVDASRLDARLARVSLELLCDVRNPLLGDEGTARVYAPQKGADADQVDELEDALERLTMVLHDQLGTSLDKEQGAGAGGGLAFGLASLCGAQIKRGFETVSEAMGLFARIAATEVVVTGEGRLDAQTSFSKGPWALGRLSKMQQKRVVAFAGELSSGPSSTREAFDEVVTVGAAGLPLPTPSQADIALETAARRWAFAFRPRPSRDDTPRL